MSLVVWLPLNGDLHNQGLSSTTFSGTAAYKSYGKLGGQSLSLQNRIICSTPALNGVQFFSIAFWCRIEANPDSTADYMDIISFTDQKSDNSTNGQFRFETGYLTDSEGGVHWHDNTTNAIINGFNRYNTAAQRNEWHHIVVTIADNSVKSYYDGALQKTQTTNLNKGHLTGSWWMGESTTRGCIQDVRIYDHCLSPKEIEEISKGLILHYPLNQLYDNNIIYDTSGYCNNGTIVGDITTITPSPRYNCATNLLTTSSHICISNLNVNGFTNSYSISWWGNVSSYSNKMMWGFSDGNHLNGIYNGNLWNTGDGASNPLYIPNTTTQVTVPTINTWHHFVMVGNGSVCLVYKDGELWGQAKTYKPLNGTTIYMNGWSNATTYALENTKLSDFRIYATVLTSSQVKELYTTSMQIDSSGNVFARELVEL